MKKPAAPTPFPRDLKHALLLELIWSLAYAAALGSFGLVHPGRVQHLETEFHLLAWLLGALAIATGCLVWRPGRGFFGLYDDLPIASLVLDGNRRILWANKAWFALSGASRAEALGHEMGDFLASPVGETGELCIQRQDGRSVFVSLDEQPLPGGSAGAGKLLVLIRDTTALVNAKRELERIEAGCRHFFSDSPCLMFVFEVRTLRMLDVNEALLVHYGYSREEFMRMSVCDLHVAEEMPMVLQTIQNKALGSTSSGPWWHRAKNGAEFRVEINSLDMSWDGKQGRCVSITDITEPKTPGRSLLDWIEAHRLARPTMNTGIAESPSANSLHDRMAELTAERDRAEQALRESEEQFRKTIEHSGVGYLRIGKQGLIEAVNSAWLSMHGLKAESQILGRPFGVIQSEPELKALEKMVQASLAGRQCAPGEFSRTREDGTLEYLRLSMHPIRRGGETLAVEGFLVDRTPLRRAVSDYRMLFDTMLDGFCLCELVKDADNQPTDCRFLAVNPAFERHTGLHSKNLVGRMVLEVLPQIDKTWVEHFHQVAQTGEAVMFECHSRTLNRHFSVSAFCPAPQRIACLIADITTRKLAEEQIREQAALLDVSQDAIFVSRLDRTLTYWNRRAESLYEISGRQSPGRLEEIIYKDVPHGYAERWEELLVLREKTVERRHTTPSGRQIDVRVRAKVLSDAAGKATAVFIVITDITESKQLEAQFFRAQRLESLGALASGVAHDLNNVLTPILMLSKLLASIAKTDEDREMLQLLNDSAQRGTDIVRQLLIFGRGSDSPRSPRNVSGTLKEVGRMVKRTFPKNIVLTVQAPSDLRSVDCDPTQIHQMVLNLCVNARDAMPGGGALSILAENTQIDAAFAKRLGGTRAGPHVLIQVQDTGSGIPPEHLDKIFDPFFTTKPVGQGTGLGLATVLGIVRSHRGLVEVESSPGQGTTFNIYLPSAASETGLATCDADSRLLTGNGELILLIEDEDNIRNILKSLLSKNNYRVLTAPNGAKGLEVHEQNASQIRLVITDTMMPVMDGGQMVKELRRRDPDLPVLAISGLPITKTELRRNFGSRVWFMSKPFDTDHALHLVREALGDEDAGQVENAAPPSTQPR
jgi:PAS domain S-box-containing protein